MSSEPGSSPDRRPTNTVPAGQTHLRPLTHSWCVSERCGQGPAVGPALTSPSGVSEGHSMPHWDGCRERGPLTFLVFSNCEEILVIMPSAEMKERRDRTWVTPWRSILNLFRDQLPCAQTNPITDHYDLFPRLLSVQIWPPHGGYGVDHAVSDLILPHVFHHVKLRRSLLGDDLVCNLLQFRVEFLEQILKEQRQKLGGRQRERQRNVSNFRTLPFPSDSDSHVTPGSVPNPPEL